MNTLSYKTRSERKEDVQRKWYVIDAENQIVGRMATKIATYLRGKHKASYTPHVDCGDYIIVLNADKLRFTGNKMADKEYITFSGYPGGQKRRKAKDILTYKPAYIIEKAVKGMLPKNKLGRAMFKKMFVYTSSEHPHAAQKPEPLAI